MQQKNIGSKRSLNNSGNKSDRLLIQSKRQSVPRSKSLEQILDSNSNSSRSSAGTQYKNNKNIKSAMRHDSNIDRTPNYWIAENTGLSRHGNVKKNIPVEPQNSSRRLPNGPIYSTPIKKSVSMHNIIDDESPSNMPKEMMISQNNIRHEYDETRLQQVGSQYHDYPDYYQTRQDINPYLQTSKHGPNENESNFVSSYCTVDNRRAPKHRGGLAKRHQQREWLQRSAMHQTENSSSASSEMDKRSPENGLLPNKASSIILSPNFDGSKTIWSPPKPPRKSLVSSSGLDKSFPIKPSSSAIKHQQQFYNAYEPLNNIAGKKTLQLRSNDDIKTGYLIPQSDAALTNENNFTLENKNDYPEIKSKNEEYMNEVNKEIEDNLRFIKEVVSKNNTTDPSNTSTNANPTMKTFGSMPKENAFETENLPPPPSYFFNGDLANENRETNNLYHPPPTPPPPPPPPPPLPKYVLPPTVSTRSNDGIDMANDPNRSSYTETPSERSEVSDLDLSMLPLDARSWSQRLARNNALNSNFISTDRNNIDQGLSNNNKKIINRHNYENHDIKTVRIAPKVTEIEYSGK